MKTRIGFCVIYRFKVHTGAEESFRQGWERLTEAIRDKRGGLGSRLHLADDGWWVAYAQWPDRETWERFQQMDTVDEVAAQTVNESVAERKPPILMEAKIDLLVST